MAELLKGEREFVIPGEEIVNSMDYLPGNNCFREGDSILTKIIGLVSVKNRIISVIPFNGIYTPKAGDMVIGEIVDIQSNGWVVDINAAHDAFLPLSGVREFIDTTRTELSRFYDLGDLIYAKIFQVSKFDSIHMSMKDINARKLAGGRIITVNPAKVPRLIGREGSMISVMKKHTGCKLNMGQNGLVWLSGEKENLAIKAIRMVEKESYAEGLTDKVSKFLEKGS